MFDNLKNAKRAVLWWSSGFDSTLLLAMLREQPVDFDIVQIRHLWTRDQLKKSDKLIADWNLKVFSYPPSTISFIGQGNEISTIFEFAVGNATMPMLRDVVHGERCIAEIGEQRLHRPPIEWDLQIVGSRKDDSHYAFNGQVVPDKRWRVGNTEFYAPLFDWTREQVVEGLKSRGLETDEVSNELDTGNVSLCTNCLNGTGKVFCPKENTLIDAVIWDRELNLTNFRNAYGL